VTSASRRIQKLYLPALVLLLALCVARLWLMPMASSFWIDEIATAFVVHYGSDHPSLAAAAPQAWQSIYYFLPRVAQAWFGFSEIAYRVPSILMMAMALYLFARLASRLIHPQAAWFTVFACLALRGIDYEAADARPYAFGMCVAGASLFFLVRWLDFAQWHNAVLFVVFSALLWRIHLLFWPFYLTFILYALARLADRDTSVRFWQVTVVFLLLGFALAPVAFGALALYREARAHVIVPPPSARELLYSLKLGLVIPCATGAWLLSRIFKWRPDSGQLTQASLTLILAAWLAEPLCLFFFSHLTGNSVFVARYISLMLPGTALAATAAAAIFIPAEQWKSLAAVLAVGVLLFLGQWRNPLPPHSNSDWRGAARSINELAGAGTPVICPSPFIEAKPPVWQPDYPLPGFLYAHLSVYPLRGKTVLFPYDSSPKAEEFALRLSREALPVQGRFILYGQHPGVLFWRDWFASRPEFAGWRNRPLGSFGDVDVVVFENPTRH